MTNTEIQSMARAVVSWLEYKDLTGMSGLFSEASLTVPIAEFLSRTHKREIEAEVAHPCFKKNGAGRPMQLDFVRKAKGEKRWIAAFECKFENGSLRAVINDLCRLLCLSQAEQLASPDRYFVFARKTGEAGRLLNTEFNVGGGRQSAFDGILKQDRDDLNVENTFRLSALHQRQKLEFRRFAKDLEKPLPSSVRTVLHGFWRGQDYCCGIWRVAPRQNHSLLQWQEVV